MATNADTALRTQLINRREKLENAIASLPGRSDLASLLREVDGALARMDIGTFGLCEVCHDPIERDRLEADPLVRFCVDHLTAPQQQALQQDLELAANIQSALLPKSGLVHSGWRTAFYYEAAGPVSGDYCDLIPAEDGSLYFIIGDVSGKGVAASMLMSHLQAMFRTLAGLELSLVHMMQRASRLFCESTLSNHYATLVCGRAQKSGEVELCNAGHLAPLIGGSDAVRSIDSTGLPLGMFCNAEFSISKAQLQKGDCLVLFTDGLTETQNRAGQEFGVNPLIEIVRDRGTQSADAIMRACLAEASEFRSGLSLMDDMTLMVLERIE